MERSKVENKCFVLEQQLLFLFLFKLVLKQLQTTGVKISFVLKPISKKKVSKLAWCQDIWNGTQRGEQKRPAAGWMPKKVKAMMQFVFFLNCPLFYF